MPGPGRGAASRGGRESRPGPAVRRLLLVLGSVLPLVLQGGSGTALAAAAGAGAAGGAALSGPAPRGAPAAGGPASGTPAPAEGADSGSMRGFFLGGGQRGPIQIDARRFEADNRRRTVTYTDQVVARQDDTTLTADRLVVSYDDARRISQVAAEGSVRIVQKGAAGAGPGGQPGPDREALCSRVVFLVEDDRILCTGTPATLRQGEDIIRGPKITVQVAEERIVVEGDRNVPRVTSRITPPPREDRKTGASSALSQ